MERSAQRLILVTALVASMAVFFATLWVVFKGHIPHVSQRTSVTTRQLEMALTPVNEELTRMEGAAREYVERLEPTRFMKRAPVAPAPAPLAPAPKKGKKDKAKAPPAPVREKPVTPLPKWDGDLPTGAKGILITDTAGLAVLNGGETGRVKSEGELKGFMQDATGRYLVLALPHQKGGQWLGTVHLFYDWVAVLERIGVRSKFEPVAKGIWSTGDGTAVVGLFDEKVEPALLTRLEERLKTYRSPNGRSYFDREGRSLVWATLSPFPLRMAVWYPDSSLGVPAISLVLLLILLVLIGILFYVNYLVMAREETGLTPRPPRDEETAEPFPATASAEKWFDSDESEIPRQTPDDDDSKWKQVEEAHRVSMDLEQELLSRPMSPTPSPIAAPPVDKPKASPFADLEDLPALPETDGETPDPELSLPEPEPADEEVNLPDEDLPEPMGRPDITLPALDAEDEGALPEVPDSVFQTSHAADPRISNLIESMDDDSTLELPERRPPFPRPRAETEVKGSSPIPPSAPSEVKKTKKPSKKRIPAARMTLKDLAEAIQARTGIWNRNKRITADLINKWPKLGESPLAVLIDNGESHVVFQDEGLSSATRGRLVIPHDHPFWMKFLSRGRILHVSENPGGSELLKRWFAPADLARVSEVVFVPIYRKKEGWFVVCATRPV